MSFSVQRRHTAAQVVAMARKHMMGPDYEAFRAEVARTLYPMRVDSRDQFLTEVNEQEERDNNV